MKGFKTLLSLSRGLCVFFVLLIQTIVWAQGEAQNIKAWGGRFDLPDISLISVMSYAHFTAPKEHLSKSGHDPLMEGFNLQEVEMGIQGQVDPRFRYDAFLSFSTHGVEIEEAYATTTDFFPRMQLKLGQFKTRFGRHNLLHLETWETVDNALSHHYLLGGEGLRNLGMEYSYLLPLPWYSELFLSLQNPQGGTAKYFVSQGNDIQAFKGDGPWDMLMNVHWDHFHDLTDQLSVKWGPSLAIGPNGTSGTESKRTAKNKSRLSSLYLYGKYRPLWGTGEQSWRFLAEYIRGERQEEERVLTSQGYTTHLVHDFNKHHSLGGRYDWYKGVNLPAKNIFKEDRKSLFYTYRPSEFSKVRLQYNQDKNRQLPKTYHEYLVQLTLTLGPHGAHTF